MSFVKKHIALRTIITVMIKFVTITMNVIPFF
jgi:hypothetical protein